MLLDALLAHIDAHCEHKARANISSSVEVAKTLAENGCLKINKGINHHVQDF